MAVVIDLEKKYAHKIWLSRQEEGKDKQLYIPCIQQGSVPIGYTVFWILSHCSKDKGAFLVGKHFDVVLML